MTESIVVFSRYILPILAVIILGLCLAALMRRKPTAINNVGILDKETGEIYSLTTRETSIGVSKNCDIVPTCKRDSKQQAVIICDRDGWYIKPVFPGEDPVLINGNPIEKASLVTNKDEIVINGAKLYFIRKN